MGECQLVSCGLGHEPMTGFCAYGNELNINKNPTRHNSMRIFNAKSLYMFRVSPHLVGFLLILNYDARNHELKI